MDRSGRQKVRFYWLVVSSLILATASIGYAAALTVNFTGTGSNVVAGYWNIGMTGGNITSSGYSVADDQTAYMDVKFDGFIQPGFQKTATIAGSAANFSVTSTEIQNLSLFAQGKSITFFVSAGAGTDEGTSAASVVDQNAPSVFNVNSSTSDAVTKMIGNVIDVEVTFYETVTVTVGTPQIELETGTSDALVDNSGGSGTATLTFQYTVASGHTSGDLRYTSSGALSLNGAVIKDAAGNSASTSLPAPGTTNSLGANKNFVVDGIRPYVSSVTSATSDGAYKADDVIFVIVNFTEAVTVAGTPQIYLETGASDTYVNYTSGSLTSSLTFNYTVLAGHTASDLDYMNTSALSAGTSIKDAAGNDATLTLAAPSQAGSLGANKDIVIDTTDPTVLSVTSTQPDGYFNEGDVIPVTITFTEDVDVTGTPTLSLNSGGTASYASGSGTTVLTFNYSVGAGENNLDLDYVNTASLSLNGGTIQDAATNAAVLTLPVVGSANSLGGSKALVVDTDPPAVSGVSSATANGTKKIGDLIAITITFDEAVTVTGTPQLTLETGASDEVVDYTSGSTTTVLTFNYTVAEGNTSNDLDYVATSSLAGTIRDAAGNDATLTLPALGGAGSLKANKDFVIDGVRPTVSAVTSSAANGSYNALDVIPVTVTFSEDVTVSGVPQITLAVPGGYAVDYSGGSGSDILTFNYTVQAGHISSDLEYFSTSALSAGTSIKDAAGNDVTLTLPGLGAASSLAGSKDLIVDTTLPTVTDVTSSVANDAYKAGATIPITVTFSEAVTKGAADPALKLETGTTDRNATYTGGTGTTVLSFEYVVQAGDESADLDYWDTAALSAGTSIRDAAGNDATLTLAALDPTGFLGDNKDIIIDTQVPTVTNVTSSLANGSYKAGVTVPITVTFSESVYVTGTPELALDVGTSATFASGDGSNTLTFNYTVSPGETSSDLAYTTINALTVVAASIKDLAGNDADLDLENPGDPGSLKNNKALVIDTTPPTVSSVSSTAADIYYVETDLIPITITFSEAVYVALATPTLTLETGASDAVVDYTAGSGTDALSFPYTVASGHESDNLDYTGTTALELNSATITDAAGNDATLTLAAPDAIGSLGLSRNRDVDAIIPTVTAVTSNKADGVYKAGVEIPVSVVFSEAMVVGGVPTLTLNVDGGYVVDYTSVSGDTLVFKYTVLALQNQVELDYVDANSLLTGGGSIRDVAGNDAVLTLASPGSANSLGGSKNIDVDTTPPTVSNVTSTTSNAAYKAGQSIDVRVTFSEVVIDAGSPHVVLETGTDDWNATYVIGKGTNTLVFIYTVVAGDSSNDLDYVNTGSLVAGISLEDSAGNPVSANPLAAPGAAGSLGANKAIIIDTRAPTVLNVTSSKTDGYYKAAEPIPVSVEFSEVVTVTGTPTLTLETGTSDAVVDYTSGSGSTTLTFDYTVQAGHNSSDLDYIVLNPLSPNGGTILDAASNDADLTTIPVPGTAGSLGANKDILIDTTPPTVSSVSSTAANGDYVAGDTISITVTLSETVYKAGAGTPTFTLETGSTDAVLDYVSGSGTDTLTFTYIVALGHESDNLDYVDENALQLNLATIRDTTGNDADLALPSPGASGSLGFGKDRNIDAVIPTVTAVTSTKADGVYKAGAMIPISVVFSEAVAVTGTPTLSLDVSGGYVVDYASGSGTDTLVFEYLILDGHNQVNLGYQSTTALNLNGGSIQDAATNPADTTLPTPTGAGSLSGTKDLIIDTAVPTVSQVTSSTVSGRYGVGDTLAISIVFSEAVTVTGGPPRLTLETDVNDTEASYTSGSGSNTLIFNYIVQAGDSSDDLGYVDTTSLSFNGAVIADAGSNVARIILPVPGGAGSLAANKDFVIDTHAPSVMSVSSTTTDGWYKAGVVIPIVVAFSERVTVSGTPTLTLDVVDGYVVNYTSGSGNAALVFNYTVRDSDDCADLDYQSSASLSLNGGVINDLGRNDADLSLPPPGADSSLGGTKNLVLDTQAPSALAAVVYDGPGADIDSSRSTDTLAVHYGVFAEAVSGISRHEYALGSTPGGTDVVDWTANGTDTLATVRDLDLVYRYTYYFSVRATDGAGNVSDSVVSDGVIIVDKPRLTVNLVQNSVISEYVQIFVNDTLAMADSIRIVMDSLRVSVTEIDTFAYVGTHKLVGSGPHGLEVTGFSGWGDTTRTSSLAMTLAKQGQPWVAASVDQRFKTSGSPGSVSGDRYLLVVDSTLMGLSAVRGRAYRLGDGQFSFNQPVRVSMRSGMNKNGREEAQAIYILRSNGRWEELPSVDEGELVTTWANSTGTFRLGRRTIIVPQTTSLHQNYPNPFNPTTRIVFDLGFQEGPLQHARVVIYNLLGQEVLTLYNGEAPAGRYELTWQGVDARGITVASGVYFVRLSTDSGRQMTRKMLLVR